MPSATFYFDLGSPFAYLTAERLNGVLSEPDLTAGRLDGVLPEPDLKAGRLDGVLSEPVAWQAVSLGALFKLNGRSSWALGGPESRQVGIAEVEARAQQYGLAPLRWPDPWPTNYLYAMRAATYAFQAGRGRDFALAAFRHSFANGYDLAIPEHVLEVAAQVDLDPGTVEEATQDTQIKLALRSATDAAHELGVFGVPTIAIDGELFWGDDRLEDAADALGQNA